MKVDFYGVISLASVICGKSEDYEDVDEVEQNLADQFEISLESFHLIIEKLVELTPTWESPLTGTTYHGFVKDGFAIVKAEAMIKAVKQNDPQP